MSNPREKPLWRQVVEEGLTALALSVLMLILYVIGWLVTK